MWLEAIKAVVATIVTTSKHTPLPFSLNRDGNTEKKEANARASIVSHQIMSGSIPRRYEQVNKIIDNRQGR